MVTSDGLAGASWSLSSVIVCAKDNKTAMTIRWVRLLLSSKQHPIPNNGYTTKKSSKINLRNNRKEAISTNTFEAASIKDWKGKTFPIFEAPFALNP